ncbi:helix-turn-helix domain-containing protein [Pseudomonas paraeruginosa]|uniref:GlxA family transcriptional regulator n=1 Tax=Pseudomonas aeruginosa group TaxID=136841 RepID=UPI00053E9874|nr:MULTISPECIES: helix-turn-helix domain-containing protein [Pseudomonas aeruginosa group]VTS53024.1 transcriptional regulator, AraC family [Streptococcus dysgalactiae subsp. equisimilis]KAB0748518.1 helix-turn-helix domain-containing protein [Pseudomonas aeruginosa]KRU92186.1 AraC family transcriptional regulator [Pseudomonas aeruginosa]KSP89205.1 AraC family transcriptional regulator [Pseudomonas aeruginosa]MBG4065722.1 helix-turn-helix domain-containing protein [Pseudomonas aeruginosa]
MPRQSVAVVAFDRISPFHLSVPCLVFGQECYDPCAQAFDLRVCAAEPGRLRTTVGFAIETGVGLEALADAQTIIVPSWRDPHERPPQALLQALVAARARGAQLVGLCLGAFVLAEAGLLDGRRATTHWMWADDFAARFPAVRVEPDVLYIEDDGLLTSAGTVAGIDCCLHLVRQRLGAQTTNHLARRLVVAPHRQGGQAQFIEQPLPDSAQDGRLGDLLVWLRQNLDQPHSLDSLARRVLMSRRTFTRHFRQLTGTTVSQWLQAERLALAQRLLETTEHSVQAIAELAGFGSAVSLRQRFSAAFGVPPLGYRRAFAS